MVCLRREHALLSVLLLHNFFQGFQLDAYGGAPVEHHRHLGIYRKRIVRCPSFLCGTCRCRDQNEKKGKKSISHSQSRKSSSSLTFPLSSKILWQFFPCPPQLGRCTSSPDARMTQPNSSRYTSSPQTSHLRTRSRTFFNITGLQPTTSVCRRHKGCRRAWDRSARPIYGRDIRGLPSMHWPRY